MPPSNMAEIRALDHAALCDCTARAEESGLEAQLFILLPSVNRGRFSPTKWLLGKAALGAMETRQLDGKGLLCPQGCIPYIMQYSLT